MTRDEQVHRRCSVTGTTTRVFHAAVWIWPLGSCSISWPLQHLCVCVMFQSNESGRRACTLIHWTIIYQTSAVLFARTPAQKQQGERSENAHSDWVLHNYFKSATRFYSASHVHNNTTKHCQHIWHPVSHSLVIFLLNKKYPLYTSRSSIIYTHNAFLTGAIPLVVMAGCSPSSSFSLLAWILPW